MPDTDLTSDQLRCPVHGIPDCSPMLNGCSRVINAAKKDDALCPVGEYDKADKAWRAATVRRRCADALRALLDTEADRIGDDQ